MLGLWWLALKKELIYIEMRAHAAETQHADAVAVPGRDGPP
jgi:hypothetical protein